MKNIIKNCIKLCHYIYNKFLDIYNKDYTIPPKNINWSVFIAILIPFFTGIGFIYLLALLGEFNISYNIYFTPTDCIKVLYEKGITLGYVFGYALMLLFLPAYFSVILPINFSRKYLSILIYLFFCLIIYIYLKVQDIPLRDILRICFVLGISFLLFKRVNQYFGILVLFVFMHLGFYHLGKFYAKKIIEEKLTFDIILKNGDTILTERGKEEYKDRYFIYKTSDYIFIKDEVNRKVIMKNASEIETILFSSEK